MEATHYARRQIPWHASCLSLRGGLDHRPWRCAIGAKKEKRVTDPAFELVEQVREHVQSCLGPNFLALYVYGSLSLGDFDEDSSDVDLLVVTEALPGEEKLACLSEAHEALFAGRNPFARELEVTYVARDSLRSFAPGKTLGFRVDRGSPKLRPSTLEVDWLVNFFALLQAGKAAYGPAPSALLPPVTREELQAAMEKLNEIWWLPVAENPEKLVPCSYRYYAVLTMARMLATREKGKIVSKKAAADWAARNLEPRWATLVRQAYLRDPSCSMEETRELIRWAAKRLAESA